MESFYTIQGEGHHQGKAAYFIRLAGCDVGCVWCDVKESWEVEEHPIVKIDQIVSDAATHEARLAVVTGGEPFMYDLSLLTAKLKSKNFQTNVETAGVYPITGEWDWICFSPKKFKEPLDEYYDRADELKVIVFNDSDFKWAQEHASKVNASCKLFLQPEWSKREAMTPKIIDYVKSHPEWEISLQTHKFMNIP